MARCYMARHFFVVEISLAATAVVKYAVNR